jgi:hypothetical protein
MGVSGQHHAPAALYPRERTPGTHWTGGCLGPRSGLDAKTRRKILCLCRGLNPGHPVHRHYTDWAIPAPPNIFIEYHCTALVLSKIVAPPAASTHHTTPEWKKRQEVTYITLPLYNVAVRSYKNQIRIVTGGGGGVKGRGCDSKLTPGMALMAFPAPETLNVSALPSLRATAFFSYWCRDHDHECPWLEGVGGVISTFVPSFFFSFVSYQGIKVCFNTTPSFKDGLRLVWSCSLVKIWGSHGGEYEDGCLLGCSAIALMMEAARTCETLVNFCQTTRRYNPEDSHLPVPLPIEGVNKGKITIKLGWYLSA